MKRKNETSGIIGYAWSLVVDQFLAVMASLVLTGIIDFFFKDGLPLLNLIACSYIFFIICYVDSWNRGFSDINRMKLGMIPKNKLRGALAGLIAAVPSFILAFFAYLTEVHGLSVYRVFEDDIMRVIHRFWQLPFNTLFRYINNEPLLNFALPMFLPIVSGFGYFLGAHGYTLRQIFVYQRDDRK